MQDNPESVRADGSRRPSQSGHCIHSQSLIHVEDEICVAVMMISEKHGLDLVMGRHADETVAEAAPNAVNYGSPKNGLSDGTNIEARVDNHVSELRAEPEAPH
jgi:hypothetical protein